MPRRTPAAHVVAAVKAAIVVIAAPLVVVTIVVFDAHADLGSTEAHVDLGRTHLDAHGGRRRGRRRDDDAGRGSTDAHLDRGRDDDALDSAMPTAATRDDRHLDVGRGGHDADAAVHVAHEAGLGWDVDEPDGPHTPALDRDLDRDLGIRLHGGDAATGDGIRGDLTVALHEELELDVLHGDDRTAVLRGDRHRRCGNRDGRGRRLRRLLGTTDARVGDERDEYEREEGTHADSGLVVGDTATIRHVGRRTDVPTVSSILTGFLDLLAPRRCPGCARNLDVAEQGWCAACEPLLERFPHAGAAYRYGGPLRDAIRRLKYGGWSDAAPLLGRMIAEGWIELPSMDCVVHVPAHPSRRAERGYDQAALLAREMARHGGVPFIRGAVVRVRDTGTQVGRTRDARKIALRGAFRAHGLSAKRVLVVDDVHTTGATFEAVRDACLEAGAMSVLTFALARAEAAEGVP